MMQHVSCNQRFGNGNTPEDTYEPEKEMVARYMVWRADARGTREVAKRSWMKVNRILTDPVLGFPFVNNSIKLPRIDGAWIMREPSYLCYSSQGPCSF